MGCERQLALMVHPGTGPNTDYIGRRLIPKENSMNTDQLLVTTGTAYLFAELIDVAVQPWGEAGQYGFYEKFQKIMSGLQFAYQNTG